MTPNQYFCMFWPNNGLEYFSIKFVYEICLIEQFFNIFICWFALFNQILAPFKGSCCVKKARINLKSTFYACFDLIMHVRLFNLILIIYFYTKYVESNNCSTFVLVIVPYMAKYWPFNMVIFWKMTKYCPKSTFQAIFYFIITGIIFGY